MLQTISLTKQACWTATRTSHVLSNENIHTPHNDKCTNPPSLSLRPTEISETMANMLTASGDRKAVCRLLCKRDK